MAWAMKKITIKSDSMVIDIFFESLIKLFIV
jgi:hypothetical protein